MVKYMIITQHTLREMNQLFINNKEEVYNLHLSVDMLLHMPIPCPQNLQLAPPMLTLLI